MTIEAGCRDNNIEIKVKDEEKRKEYEEENGDEERGKQQRRDEGEEEDTNILQEVKLNEAPEVSEVMVGKGVTIFLMEPNYSSVSLWLPA